ncbi:MAG: DUF1573 domain-containing protein [Deltaproteobacteria bacterium]|nr:DUF1573 domain-containing protein [Deltaproteobacteria bacterium]MBW2074214.1 DUF1573 domain-containing protein [Deltaproteobacteria bacterium]RLB84019.1 MAG: hypothetical protein DRH17_00645 [Deltaproteobacteria bacterium]
MAPRWHWLKLLSLLVCLAFLLGPASAADGRDLEDAQGTPGMASDTGPQLTPRVSIVERTFQFEPVFEGTPVRHTFKLKNTGTGPLLIHKVGAS